MNKKLSWKERMQNFAKKVKETDEKGAAKIRDGTDSLSNTMNEGIDRFNTSLDKYNDRIEKVIIEKVVSSEIRIIELKAKHPDIDIQDVLDSIAQPSNVPVTKMKDRRKNDEIKARCEVTIAELKVKHPNLDWEKLEKKIMEKLRYY